MTVLLARRALDAGSHEVIAPVPDTAQWAAVRAERVQWPRSTGPVAECRVELSLDNGLTYAFLCGFKAPGGVEQEATHSGLQFPLPVGAGRVLRVTLRNAAHLSTELTLETF